jgi:hypothetical protein
MIDLNVNIYQVGQNKFEFSLDSADTQELVAMLYKFNDLANIKISRPKDSKTYRQLKTAYALTTAFYLSGYASMPDKCTAEKYRWLKKRDYGPCFEVDYKGQIVPTPYSFADYSKEQMMGYIDSILAEIKNAGAEADKEIQKIIIGMEKNQKLREANQ